MLQSADERVHLRGTQIAEDVLEKAGSDLGKRTLGGSTFRGERHLADTAVVARSPAPDETVLFQQIDEPRGVVAILLQQLAYLGLGQAVAFPEEVEERPALHSDFQACLSKAMRELLAHSRMRQV